MYGDYKWYSPRPILCTWPWKKAVEEEKEKKEITMTMKKVMVHTTAGE